MANTILIKRGTKADIESLTLLPGELGVALDTQELYVGDASGNRQLVKGGASGAVESAGKLTTPRKIEITGDGTGQTNFDGSQDVQIAFTLATSGVTAGTYTKVTVDDKGRITTGTTLGVSDLPTITIQDISGLETALNAKANSADVYNKSELYTKTEIDSEVEALEQSIAAKADASALANKADKATTLAGYGITDAYTSATIDGKLADKADASTVSELSSTVAEKADSATTLAGYGITDAYTKTEVDAKVSSVYKYKGSVANKEALPTSKQVIGDVYNLEDTGGNVAWDGTKWDDLGSTVDLSAYLTIENAASTYATITTVNNKADKATTLAGYGITDAYTKNEVTGFLGDKADKSTTLEGYGITDAYTQTEVNNLLNAKANKSTTLAGYGITDAYTKTEVDAEINSVETIVATKLGPNDTIDGGTF